MMSSRSFFFGCVRTNGDQCRQYNDPWERQSFTFGPDRKIGKELERSRVWTLLKSKFHQHLYKKNITSLRRVDLLKLYRLVSERGHRGDLKGEVLSQWGLGKVSSIYLTTLDVFIVCYLSNQNTSTTLLSVLKF